MEIEVEATTAQLSLTANIFFAWAWLIPMLPLLAFAALQVEDLWLDIVKRIEARTPGLTAAA
jgi:hypothetical protein